MTTCSGPSSTRSWRRAGWVPRTGRGPSPHPGHRHRRRRWSNGSGRRYRPRRPCRLDPGTGSGDGSARPRRQQATAPVRELETERAVITLNERNGHMVNTLTTRIPTRRQNEKRNHGAPPLPTAGHHPCPATPPPRQSREQSVRRMPLKPTRFEVIPAPTSRARSPRIRVWALRDQLDSGSGTGTRRARTMRS